MLCPNFKICRNTTDENICYDCNMLFGSWRGYKGNLSKKSNILCPLCSQVGLGISRPTCNHFICTDCFKILYFGTKTKIIDDNINISEYLDYINSLKICKECNLSK